MLIEQNKTGKWQSEALGVNPATVSKWCTNTPQPDLNTLNRMAERLKVEMGELKKYNYKTKKMKSSSICLKLKELRKVKQKTIKPVGGINLVST